MTRNCGLLEDTTSRDRVEYKSEMQEWLRIRFNIIVKAQIKLGRGWVGFLEGILGVGISQGYIFLLGDRCRKETITVFLWFTDDLANR